MRPAALLVRAEFLDAAAPLFQDGEVTGSFNIVDDVFGVFDRVRLVVEPKDTLLVGHQAPPC